MEKNPHSFTEENYLKAIYKLSGKNAASTNAIAEKLQTKAASVTDMLKRLSQKKLIRYKKYQGVTLSAAGERLAVNIIRRHRLWEFFLVHQLGFRWDEVHEMAEHLEHIGSDELVNRLDRFLKYPRHDPHGDPIPDREGKLHEELSPTLADMKTEQEALMTGVVNHSPEFLRYLSDLGLTLGCKLRVTTKHAFDHSMHIRVNTSKPFHVSQEVAKNVLISLKK